MPKPKILRVRTEDNTFQRAEVIKRNREKRTRYGQFLLEGVSQISLAQQFGWSFHSLLYSAGRSLSKWATEMLTSVEAEYHVELSPHLLEKLSDKDDPSELLAIVEMRKMELSELKASGSSLYVVFDRPSSPGNLGSSIRSADAFGAQGVIVTGHAVDIYDPHVVRGSMGALFALPVITARSHIEVKEWADALRLEHPNLQIIGSSGKADAELSQINFTKPSIIIMGNETVGMSRGYWEICDSTIRIPIGGALSSLNVSCATSIILYEATRQRAL